MKTMHHNDVNEWVEQYTRAVGVDIRMGRI